MADYTILVCPVCGEQVEEDHEYGAYCHHDRYGQVAPIEVAVDPINLSAAIGLGRFRLDEEQREKDFQTAERRWFWGLPRAERERIRQEQIECLSGSVKTRAELAGRLAENQREMLRHYATETATNLEETAPLLTFMFNSSVADSEQEGR